MRATNVLILAFVLLGLPASQGLAIPLCRQVNTGLCMGYDECTKSIVFSACENGVRQWRCKWDCGIGGIGYGPWSECWCDGSGGPGCDCLLEGTPIALADGDSKPVEKIRKGDRVLSYDESRGATISSEVVSVHAPYVTDSYLVINDTIRLTEGHPVLSEGMWVSAGELRRGDFLTAVDGSDRLVFHIRRIEEAATVYNFQVLAGTYVAHGLVVHNKEDCWLYEQYPCFECEP